MDVLIREKNGNDEIWYSENYLKKQVELAYQAGIHRGIRVEFHALEPSNLENAKKLVDEFKNRVYKEFENAFKNAEVWKISK